jgi:DNA-directed RNA polymerase subunit L
MLYSGATLWLKTEECNLELNLLSEKGNTIEIELIDVNETLTQLLLDMLLASDEVETALYSINHPLLDKPKIIVKSKKLKPTTAIKKVTERIIEDFEACEKLFKKAAK